MAHLPSHDFPGFMDPDHLMSALPGMAARRYDEMLRCYPVALLSGPDRSVAHHGGKMFLPSSSLDKLSRLEVTYPMLFEISNIQVHDGRIAHAGVLEFVAEEGRVYLPQWLMDSLGLNTLDVVRIKSTDLPLGSFIKLQPQSTDFLQINNPRAVLENAFRNFSCLTTGDIFRFQYNGKEYSMAVLEVKPETEKRAICTIETDLSVDFAPPVGYEEELERQKQQQEIEAPAPAVAPDGLGTMAREIEYSKLVQSGPADQTASESIFSGEGRRLGAKKTGKSVRSSLGGSQFGSQSQSTMSDSNWQSSSSMMTGASSSMMTGASSMMTGASSSMMTAASSLMASATGDSKPNNEDEEPQPLRLPANQLFFGYPVTPFEPEEDGDVDLDGDGPKKPDYFGSAGRRVGRP